MKQRNYGTAFLLGAILLMAGLSVGCRVIFFTGAVAVGTAGAVGYSVYKGGESVVTGAGNLVDGETENTSTQVDTVVISGKIFKVECAGSVEQVWLAAARAFRRANFQNVTGNYDLLSGFLTAQTWDKLPVNLNLRNAGENRTTLRIWTGAQDDLQVSQSIYNLILGELNKTVATHPPTSQPEVTP